jgi:hypothetical protein
VESSAYPGDLLTDPLTRFLSSRTIHQLCKRKPNKCFQLDPFLVVIWEGTLI